MRRLSLLMLPLVLLGCVDPDFNRPELLKLPRVLAIQAEPPQPSFGTSTTLRALIYQPPAKADAPECAGVPPGPQYHWSWCPFSTSSKDRYECPAEAQQALAGLAATLGFPAPQLDLGTGETATLVNPFPAELLYALCKGDIPIQSPSLPPGVSGSGIDAGAMSIFGCRFSAGDDPNKNLAESRPTAFPVTVRLEFTPACGSPPQEKYGTPLITVFTVFLPTDETVPPNQNPEVGAIYAYPALKGSAPLSAVAGGGKPDADTGEPPDAQPASDGGASDDGGAAYDGGGAYDASPPPDRPGPPGGSLTPPPGTSDLAEVSFPRQKRAGLWVQLPESSSEFLPRPALFDVVKNDPSDMRVYHFEQLDVAWFTEAGDFGGEHGRGGSQTGYELTYNTETRPDIDLANLETRARQNYIAFPLVEDYRPSQSRFIVVVRDSRGGVTWTSGVANLEDHP